MNSSKLLGNTKQILECHLINRGSFNNYVDKMRGERGQQMFVFVHAQGTKTVHAGGGGGSKNDKILSTELLNAP